MLNDKRIKEAESNVRSYIADGILKKKHDDVAKTIFLKNAKDSLKGAKLMFDNELPLWTIVCSYYSMFYISNAVLLALGYKTGDKIVHKVTADTLIAIVRDKLKKNLIEDYESVQEEAMKIAEIKI